MNKYQEALNNLEDIICELSCELKQDYELYTRETGYEKYINILQELVDKATPLLDKETPKKVIIINHSKLGHSYATHCPNCNERVIWEDNRCLECGQKLDWSD